MELFHQSVRYELHASEDGLSVHILSNPLIVLEGGLGYCCVRSLITVLCVHMVVVHFRGGKLR